MPSPGGRGAEKRSRLIKREVRRAVFWEQVSFPHFPDSDPRYAGADSIRILGEVWALAKSRGWRMGNADLTIFAQAPKLRPHLDAMRQRIADAISIERDRVNVKATNPEGIGALGRGDGMAAAAIVMLEAD